MSRNIVLIGASTGTTCNGQQVNRHRILESPTRNTETRAHYADIFRSISCGLHSGMSKEREEQKERRE